MGLLTDIKSGKSGARGPGAIIVWLAAGAALGAGLAQMMPHPTESVGAVLALMGGIIGIAIGFYAAWGTSKLAKVLAAPGIIVDVLADFVG
jgi:hypothetical protein